MIVLVANAGLEAPNENLGVCGGGWPPALILPLGVAEAKDTLANGFFLIAGVLVVLLADVRGFVEDAEVGARTGPPLENLDRL